MLNDEQFLPFQQLFISVGLGLIVGLQREWAESPIAGIRSFSIVSIMGTICGLLSHRLGSGIIYLGISGILGITLIEKITLMNKIKLHRGIVTEVSLLTMFLIGVLVSTGPIILATSIAGLLTVILHVKLELHRFAAKFSKEEIRSIMQFVAITLVIFPILPTTSFGPNNVLNLPQIWLMVIFINGISLMGQIIYKFKGEKNGVIWAGLIGGMISSTATTLNSSRMIRVTQNKLVYYSIIISIAWMTLYFRVFIELLTVSPEFNVTLPLFILMIVSALSISIVWKKNHTHISDNNIKYNPTSLKTALSFAFFYSVVIYLFAFMKEEMGSQTQAVVAFISGIVDVDAITLSTGRLVEKGIITAEQGYQHLFLALFANLLFKGIISLAIGGKELFKMICIPWFTSIIFHAGILLYSFIWQ
jgi:uncharacterized membrane protein (DUF4010 family)